MAARGWWWQRIHPVPRVLLAAAYFGGAVVVFVLAITPGLGDMPPHREDVAPDQPTESTLPEEQPATPSTGAELYASNCASCHGPVLEGGSGPALGRGSEAADEIDKRIRSRINDGRNDMPGFSDKLNEEEVELVLDFLREQQN